MKKYASSRCTTGKTLLLSAILLSGHISAKADLYSVLIKAGDYIMGKVVEGIDGGIMDTAERMVTREGESIASAGAVWMDHGNSVNAIWYADEFSGYQQTYQQNHLQGEEHVNGGFELLDRDFSYHHWHVYNIDESGKIITQSQVAGDGIVTVVNDEETWIGTGTIKYWDAKYVIFSNYSNSGGEGLRDPQGKFALEIRFKLADLDYTLADGLTSSERDRMSRFPVKVSKIQADKVTNIDLLPDNTEITLGPSAHGICKRKWKAQWPNDSLINWSSMAIHNPKELIDTLINEHDWIVYEYDIDYGKD